jgi:hypothetical protein
VVDRVLGSEVTDPLGSFVVGGGGDHRDLRQQGVRELEQHRADAAGGADHQERAGGLRGEAEVVDGS